MNCEYRYTRSLSEKLRHGRWTEAEDIVCFIVYLYNLF